MFALLAAVLFVVGVFVSHVPDSSYVFWVMLGLAAWALHHAFAIAIPTGRNR